MKTLRGKQNLNRIKMLESPYWTKVYESILSMFIQKGLKDVNNDAETVEEVYNEMRSSGSRVAKVDFFRLMGIDYSTHKKKMLKLKK